MTGIMCFQACQQSHECFNDESMKTSYIFPLSLIVSLIFYFIKLIPLHIALLVTAEHSKFRNFIKFTVIELRIIEVCTIYFQLISFLSGR